MISFKRLGSMGRIGNQLHQLSAVISFALENNTNYLFPSWKYESSFNLHGCFADNIIAKAEYLEPFFHYQPIPYQEDLNLIGFFQSERYFANNRDVIIGLLTPRDGLPRKQSCCSIHVRRGDYLTLPQHYHQLQMDYYQRAMQLVGSKKYLIVSDDIAWCRSQFRGPQFEFSESNDPVMDIRLQIACENNIIANSTFSWWGAYLNKNPSKIVVAPQRWFGSAQPHDTKDLLPSSWLKIT